MRPAKLRPLEALGFPAPGGYHSTNLWPPTHLMPTNQHSSTDAPVRIGSVPYLNAAPLTHGLEREIVFLPPSRLALELRAGRLDAALLSVTEALFHDGYDLLSGPGIVSRGPVFSVGVAHRVPLEKVTEIHVDTASGTSVNLLRVFLAARGLQPRLVPLTDYASAPAVPAVLLIGNAAIDFRRAGHGHDWWDFGDAWQRAEGLPFVYAVWVLRRIPGLDPLKATLLAAAHAGLAALPDLIASRPEYDPAFRREYLGGCIQFDVDAAARSGLDRFAERLRSLDDRTVFPPHWVR